MTHAFPCAGDINQLTKWVTLAEDIPEIRGKEGAGRGGQGRRTEIGGRSKGGSWLGMLLFCLTVLLGNQIQAPDRDFKW